MVLALAPPRMPKPGSLASIAASLMTPKASVEGGSPRTFEIARPRPGTLWGRLRHDALDHPSVESSTPPNEEV
mgnify:FL=1